MKKIKPILFKEENLLGKEQCVNNTVGKFSPSGSGSGEITSRVEGEGEVHLTPTNYSDGNYSWDFEGGANWKASARVVFSNGVWVLDTLSVSLISSSASISISGHSYTSSDEEYVSNSGSVTIDSLLNMGADVSGGTMVVVSGAKKEKVSGDTIETYSKTLNVFISFKILLSADGTKLTSDLGNISVG